MNELQKENFEKNLDIIDKTVKGLMGVISNLDDSLDLERQDQAKRVALYLYGHEALEIPFVTLLDEILNPVELRDTLAKSLREEEISDYLVCPECGEVFDSESFGHPYDAIAEHQKCVDCLGSCPYCEDTKENKMNIKFVTEIEVKDPDTGNMVKVTIYKEEAGGMIGIDSSYPFDEETTSPYGNGILNEIEE